MTPAVKQVVLFPAPLNPRTLGSLAAWYDVSRIPAAFIDGSNRVSLIPDLSGNSDVNGLVLNGVSGNYASVPDNSAVSITGDIDLRCYLSLPNWVPSTYFVTHGKFTSTGNQRSYQFGINTAGKLELSTSSLGTAASTTTATCSTTTGFAAYAARWIRVTRASSTGTVQFFTSVDGSSWSQLGTDIATTAGAIFDSTSILLLAANNDLTVFGTGVMYRSQIYNGIGGTLAFDANFTAAAKLATSFTESSANAATVTINSSGDLGARICGERDLYQATATKQPIYSIGADGRPVVTFDGTDDFMGTSALAGALSFASGATVYAVSQRGGSTGANEYMILYLGNDSTYSPNNNWIGMDYQSSGDTTPNAYASGNYNNPTDKSAKATSAATLNQRYVTVGSTAAAGGTNALYVNRTQYTTASAVAISINASAYLALGRRGNASVGFLNGKFNEGMLFNTSFNQATCDRLSLYGGKKWGVAV